MLTLPLIVAAISAGLIGGFHCVGMCGGIASMLSRLPTLKTSLAASANSSSQYPAQKVISILPYANTTLTPHSQDQTPNKQFEYQCKLHGGRLTTYMLIGAFFGALGAASLRWKADLPVTTIFFVLGNVALILLGLRLLGLRMHAIVPSIINKMFNQTYASLMPTAQKASRHPYVLGLAWGSLPCGLSYAIAPFALLSGAAWSGAVLMLLFGLAALPHLLIAQAMSRQLQQRGWIWVMQIVFAATLIGLGIFGLVYFDMKNMPDFLCVTPTY